MSERTDVETVEELLRRRHSCRSFLDCEVPEAVIRRAFAMAQRTASWCNSQPWQVIVTRGAETTRFREGMLAEIDAGIEDRSDIAWPSAYRGVYLDRRRECGYALYEAIGIARGDRDASARQAHANFHLFGAPHVAIITTDGELGQYGALDCGGYVGTLLLALESLGIASIAQAALASRSGFVRRHFGLGQDRLVLCGVSFGYEDISHPANAFRTSRASVDEAVKFLG